MLKKLKFFIFALSFALTTILTAYVCLSIAIGSLLTVADFTRFSTTIIWNSILHADENGGLRTLRLARKAVLNPIPNLTIKIDDKQYTYPLPKFSVYLGGHDYLTFASIHELLHYCYKELPAAGWKHVDQFGAGHILEGYGMGVGFVHQFYLGRGISKFHLSITKD